MFDEPSRDDSSAVSFVVALLFSLEMATMGIKRRSFMFAMFVYLLVFGWNTTFARHFRRFFLATESRPESTTSSEMNGFKESMFASES